MEGMEVNIHELLHILRSENGRKITEIAEEIGVSKQFVSDKLRAEEMYVRTASKFLSAFGYRLVAVPKSTKVRDSWYEIV